MSATAAWISSSSNGAVVNGSNTYFLLTNGGLAGSTTESTRQHTMRVAGTFSNIYLILSANATTSASTVRFRKNTANGNQNFTIGAGLTGEFEGDLVNTDIVASGDLVGLLVTNGGGGDLTVTVVSILFAATSNTSVAFGANGLSNTVTDNSADDHFFSITARGGFDGNTTEAKAQQKINTAGTLKNATCSVSLNNRSSTTTLKIRINGSTKTIAMAIAGTTTGTFEDTTHSDAVAAGDLVCWTYTSGNDAGAQLNWNYMVVQFETTNDQFALGGFGEGSNMTVSAGSTVYASFGSSGNSSTESSFRTEINLALNVSKLWIYVSSNATSSSSTVNLRINGVSSTNNTLTIGAGATGAFEAGGNTDTLAATDEVNIQVVNGGGGSLVLSGFTALFSQVAVANNARQSQFMLFFPATTR